MREYDYSQWGSRSSRGLSPSTLRTSETVQRETRLAWMQRDLTDLVQTAMKRNELPETGGKLEYAKFYPSDLTSAQTIFKNLGWNAAYTPEEVHPKDKTPFVKHYFTLMPVSQ